MDFETAQRIIAAGEGQQVEFKESFSEDEDAIRSLCAFANTQGGTVFFGVSDDGRVKGVSLGHNTIEAFANKLRSQTEPPLTPTIDSITLAGHTVTCITARRAKDDQPFFASGIAYVRVGKTDHKMSPDDIKVRYYSCFAAEKVAHKPGQQPPSARNESWDDTEKNRIAWYEENKGLFLVHACTPSKKKGQVADIAIRLWQHGEGPLTKGIVKSVEYHLGVKFSDHTEVRTDAATGFQLEVSAYAPMLCFATVNFDDGAPPLHLNRYIDFSGLDDTAVARPSA